MKDEDVLLVMTALQILLEDAKERHGGYWPWYSSQNNFLQEVIKARVEELRL